jgi:hypothetical protein
MPSAVEHVLSSCCVALLAFSFSLTTAAVLPVLPADEIERVAKANR